MGSSLRGRAVAVEYGNPLYFLAILTSPETPAGELATTSVPPKKKRRAEQVRAAPGQAA